MMGGRWLIGACLLAGCFKPAFPTGAACVDDTDCPNGQLCVEKTCGGTPSDMPADAPAADIDAPDGPPGSTQIVLGDDPAELRDAEILRGEMNFGLGDHVSVDDDDFALIRFDLSAIPSSATVLGAALTVKTFDFAATDGGTILVHRLRESWDEETVTFELRNATQPWATTGALPPSSDVTPVATIAPGAINTDYTVDVPIDLVQAWVANPSLNFGLLFVVGTTQVHVHLRTRENAPGSRLVVTYR